MASANDSRIEINVADEDSAVIGVASRTFRRFYAKSRVELTGTVLRLSSTEMTCIQLRTAWLCHLFDARTREKADQARDALFRDLFS